MLFTKLPLSPMDLVSKRALVAVAAGIGRHRRERARREEPGRVGAVFIDRAGRIGAGLGPRSGGV